MAQPLRYVVLISGSGTNLQALLNAGERGEIQGELAAVISNRPDAKGLDRAHRHGVKTVVVDHTQYADRESYDAALMAAIDTHAPDLVVLAGFMRILTPGFVNHYEGRLLNIHPSLLPAYKGLHTHQRAIDAGEIRHGCSVHFVTPELDGGPVIAQAHVPVLPGDTAEALAARVQAMEHPLYVRVVGLFMAGQLTFDRESGIVLLQGRPMLPGEIDMEMPAA